MASDDVNKLIMALTRVNPETNEMIMNIANSTTKSEIISLFNQSALDFFSTVLEITKKLGKEKEFGIGVYMNLFESTLKINVNLPIDQFAASILEFAPDIYAENEDCFLNMQIPDAKVKTGNEFNIIRSEKFKALWISGSPENKNIVKEKIISLTTFCHAYFFQLIVNK